MTDAGAPSSGPPEFPLEQLLEGGRAWCCSCAGFTIISTTYVALTCALLTLVALADVGYCPCLSAGTRGLLVNCIDLEVFPSRRLFYQELKLRRRCVYVYLYYQTHYQSYTYQCYRYVHQLEAQTYVLICLFTRIPMSATYVPNQGQLSFRRDL